MPPHRWIRLPFPRRPRALAFACALALAIVAGLAFTPDTASADPAIEGPAQRLFQRIMSPYCPGLQLAACPSPQADALRNEIRAELIAGKSSDAIEADLHRRFGNGTRGEPAFAGIGRIAWIVPLVAFLAGGLALILWLRRAGAQGTTHAATDAAAGAAMDDARAPRVRSGGDPPDAAAAEALRRRLDDELAEM